MEENKIHDGDIAVSSEEDIAKLKEQIKDEVVSENTPNDQQNELFKKVLEEATMPVELTDADFKLGDNELDIRKLSKKNLDQMFFRQGVLNAIYLKQCLTSIIDCTRLLMVIADKLGVDDIVQATDVVIEKVTAKNQQLQELVKKAKEETKA